MFVDIWAWFNQYRQEAIQEGNRLKQRLVDVAYEGWEYRKLAQAQNAIDSFQEGLKIAKLLHEPCWELFYSYWTAIIYLYVQYDYQKTLDSSVRLVAELRKEKYQNCVIRGSIVFLLAKIYLLLDLNAYEKEILSLLEYLEKEVGMDEDTYLQILDMHIEIELFHKRYESAREKSQDLINRSKNRVFRLYDGYRTLRRIAFIQGDIPLALNYNRVALEQAQAMVIQNCIAYEKLWEAIFLKYLGDDALAREKYYAALAHFQQYALPLDGEYHMAKAEYLELDKQLDEAIKLQEGLIAGVHNNPSISNQIDAYCIYISLLARNKRDFSEPLAKVKSIAGKSLNPEPYLARIHYIEAGNYFEYEWQKTSRKNSLTLD